MQKFDAGRLVATPGALAAFEAAGEGPWDYLLRHLAGDWGELDEEDKQENEYALRNSLRVLSAYPLKTGQRVWVITEADRSVTTFLLPSEY
jgi:hypothetical protein